MKLNPFENKRVFRDRAGKSQTVVRDTYVNQTTPTPPKKAEPKKEEVKPTSKKKTYKSKPNETERLLPESNPGKQVSGSSEGN